MSDLISIIVPVFQVKKYIRKCLDTIIGQTFEYIEIILIDDGSTDESGFICDMYAEKDNRLKVIHKENGGLSSARNVGLEYAKGDYIAFVDSDDWVDLDYIRKMYEVCRLHDCDVCQCGIYDAINDDMEIRDSGGVPSIYTPLEFAYAEMSLLSWDCVVCWNKLYKSELFKEIRFPEGKIHEDEYTTYKVLNRANRIALLPTRLYYYRRRPESIVAKKYSYKRLDARDAYIEREGFYHDLGEVRLEASVKARHLQWLKGQQKQFISVEAREEVLEREISDEQNRLNDELKHFNPLRTDFLRNMYVFPFDLVQKRCCIAIYGGGMLGQQYFQQIRATNYCDIKCWVDRDYKKLRQIGIPVEETGKIKDYDFDYVVVAIVRSEIAAEIINMLVSEYAIEREKIIYSLNSVMNVTPYDNRIL